jgi:hypothetical protein
MGAACQASEAMMALHCRRMSVSQDALLRPKYATVFRLSLDLAADTIWFDPA